jgi:WD40 repeat protein
VNDYRSILERAGSRFRPIDLPLERIERGRDRLRRNQRIQAGVLGLMVAVGLAWVGVSTMRSMRSVPGAIDWESVPGVSVDGDALVDIRTGEVTPLPDSITSFRNAEGYAVAPGGDVLLFEASVGGSSDNLFTTCGAEPHQNRACQIFVANVDGTDLRQLTDAPGGSAAGGWSPDGTKIVALLDSPAGRRLDVDIVLIDVAAGETTRVASGHAGDFLEPHFDADGQRILFSRYTKPRGVSGGSDVFGIPLEGGDVALVLEDRWNATFSPDGRTITYEESGLIGTNLGGPVVRLADADGSDPRPLVHGEAFSDAPYWSPVQLEAFSLRPSWSPDGTRIVYTRWTKDEGARVVVVDVASGMPTLSVLGPEVHAAVWLDDNTLLVDSRGCLACL